MAKGVFGRRGWAMIAFVATAAVIGVLAMIAGPEDWPTTARAGSDTETAYVELGQFTAPITRVDGARGFLLVQARAAVSDQATALRVSTAHPLTRHAGLRAVYSLAAQGEVMMDVDGVAEALRDAVNHALGAEVVDTVYVDRLLIQ